MSPIGTWKSPIARNVHVSLAMQQTASRQTRGENVQMFRGKKSLSFYQKKNNKNNLEIRRRCDRSFSTSAPDDPHWSFSELLANYHSCWKLRTSWQLRSQSCHDANGVGICCSLRMCWRKNGTHMKKIEKHLWTMNFMNTSWLTR